VFSSRARVTAGHGSSTSRTDDAPGPRDGMDDERDVAVVGGKARRPLSPHHGVRSVVNCCSFGRQRACRSFVRSSRHRRAGLRDDEKGSGKMTPEGGAAVTGGEDGSATTKRKFWMRGQAVERVVEKRLTEIERATRAETRSEASRYSSLYKRLRVILSTSRNCSWPTRTA
jgi:hypothetical protein